MSSSPGSVELGRSRLVFGEVIAAMGGRAVMQILLEDARRALEDRSTSVEGIVVDDACEDEMSTVTMAVRADEVEFAFCGQPSQVLPLAEVEALVTEPPAAAAPPLAA